MSSLSRLSRYSTCDASDVLLALGVECGGYLADLLPIDGGATGTICGPAFTVKLVLKNDDEQPRMAGHWADSIPPDSIVFLSAPANLPNAVWGGLMSLRACVRGAKAAIVDGRVRDLEELKESGLPLLARGISATSAQATTHASAINVDVTVNTSALATYASQPVIHPGDVLVVDSHGAVCVPRDALDDVLDRLPRWVAGEEQVKQAVKDGMDVQEAFKRFRGK